MNNCYSYLILFFKHFALQWFHILSIKFGKIFDNKNQ